MDTDKRTVYEFGDFLLESGQRRLLRRESGESGGGQPLALTPKAFDTLLLLIEHRGETLDKDTLLSRIWSGVIVEENSLTQNISTLRQVLGEMRTENRYIATVPRKGYRFVGQVTERAAPTGPRSPQPMWMWAAALVVMVGVGAFLFEWSRGGHSAPSATSAPPAIQTLAVLPFKPLLPMERAQRDA
jgi:DNA-binding winged helix-turn-helix (wHTH) protein